MTHTIKIFSYRIIVKLVIMLNSYSCILVPQTVCSAVVCDRQLKKRTVLTLFML